MTTASEDQALAAIKAQAIAYMSELPTMLMTADQIENMVIEFVLEKIAEARNLPLDTITPMATFDPGARRVRLELLVDRKSDGQ